MGNPNIHDYILFTRQTAIYPPECSLEYLSLGLASEAGEVGGVVKKYLRKDCDFETAREKLKRELGDVLWYWARLCDELGLEVEQVLSANMEKLSARKANNTLRGDGDDR
ncbi:MAG: nucleoside triphosphate pyrophosphohydrolase family protein [Geminocystis sp.]|nr:nucleoside triphosphate pyrophosphohydrolase family protein [Geminocystis sp.]HIK38150.1 nucleoside triphosphate pyrophosphohydrolase family protein [Geminocystis sp. M7585_C2015_104]MCS7148809.1 nucleoside triphosphate pyrophosphohydrolase family protein [Geminocystis sp.]MCX8078443.1 nucleoside triphosphate pyrophosphohydrolase family protein [Geminocystis sp.]MDW8115353.1 nucleoside triphosphate pyrophosphohydrolase family protein [Geminocystis sp.]